MAGFQPVEPLPDVTQAGVKQVGMDDVATDRLIRQSHANDRARAEKSVPPPLFQPRLRIPEDNPTWIWGCDVSSISLTKVLPAGTVEFTWRARELVPLGSFTI